MITDDIPRSIDRCAKLFLGVGFPRHKQDVANGFQVARQVVDHGVEALLQVIERKLHAIHASAQQLDLAPLLRKRQELARGVVGSNRLSTFPDISPLSLSTPLEK